MTKTELSHHLTIVSIEMLHLAMEMEAMGGDLYVQHAQELAGAALIARDWSTEIGIEALAAVEPGPVPVPTRCCGTCHYRAAAVCEWSRRRVGTGPVPFWFWTPLGMVRESDGRSCLAYVSGTSGVGP